jgi:hypothetical protein
MAVKVIGCSSVAGFRRRADLVVVTDSDFAHSGAARKEHSDAEGEVEGGTDAGLRRRSIGFEVHQGTRNTMRTLIRLHFPAFRSVCFEE